MENATLEQGIETFIENANKIRKAYFLKSYSKEFEEIHGTYLKLKKGGRKYAKIVTGTSVFCFIEKETGDIYKPASWSAPAKHARGNIHNNKGEGSLSAGAQGIYYLVR